jgi:hypothetical protein
MGFFSRPQSTWWSQRFGPAISLVVTESLLQFRGADAVLSLAPVLFVRDGLIVAVGEPPSGPAERLDVFVADRRDRGQRLAKLVQYGLHCVMGRGLTLKPVVTVSLQTLAVSLGELRPALIAAGAAEVSESPR